MASPRMAQLAQRMCSGGVKQAVTEAIESRAREFFSPAFKVGAAGYGIAPRQREQTYVLGAHGGLGGLGDWWPPSMWGKDSHAATHNESPGTEHISTGDQGSTGEVEATIFTKPSGGLSNIGIAAVVAGGLLVAAAATGTIGRLLRKR